MFKNHPKLTPYENFGDKAGKWRGNRAREHYEVAVGENARAERPSARHQGALVPGGDAAATEAERRKLEARPTREPGESIFGWGVILRFSTLRLGTGEARPPVPPPKTSSATIVMIQLSNRTKRIHRNLR